MNQIVRQFEHIQTQLAQKESHASLFHEQSKTRPNVLFAPPVNFDPALLPDFSRRAFKEYRLAPRISLPEAQPLPVSLDKLIRQRRTIRRFTNVAVTLEETAGQLALSYRVTKPGSPHRPVPSGGALYPLEIYLSSLNIEGLDQGLFHYHPVYHALECLSPEPPLSTLQHIFLPDTLPPGAAYVICICGVLPRNQFKYGELGYRLMLLEAGHLAQNILLVAQAQSLAGQPVCGFYDDRMHDYLEVDGVDEVCLYLLVIGRPYST
jgi:SagB-type dehydrogenase family enzyme